MKKLFVLVALLIPLMLAGTWETDAGGGQLTDLSDVTAVDGNSGIVQMGTGAADIPGAIGVYDGSQNIGPSTRTLLTVATVLSHATNCTDATTGLSGLPGDICVDRDDTKTWICTSATACVKNDGNWKPVAVNLTDLLDITAKKGSGTIVVTAEDADVETAFTMAMFDSSGNGTIAPATFTSVQVNLIHSTSDCNNDIVSAPLSALCRDSDDGTIWICAGLVTGALCLDSQTDWERLDLASLGDVTGVEGTGTVVQMGIAEAQVDGNFASFDANGNVLDSDVAKADVGTNTTNLSDGSLHTTAAELATPKVNVVSLASGALTVNTVHLATATAADYDIPIAACDAAGDIGNWITIIVEDDSSTIVITLDDASNIMVVPGLSLSAGDELDSSGSATGNGEHITLTCTSAEVWFATNMFGAWADGTP